MTVASLCEQLHLTALALPEPDREIRGVYCGDLLSWVMGRAKSDQAWLTIMSNVNVVAVGSLADVSCVILAEGVTVENEVAETARKKGVNLLSCPLPLYELSLALGKLV